MPSFVVSTVFKGQDLLTPIFKRMAGSASLFGDKSSRAFAKASRSASSFGTIVKGILTAGLVQRGVSALVGGTRKVVGEYVDFDQALTAAGAKFPEVVKRGTEGFKELGAVARKVGGETQFTASDAAKGLDFLAMAGFDAKQAMALLPGVTNLATIADSDLARATDIASDALGAFGLMSKDTGQLTSNFARVLDVMSKTVTSSNVDMEQLFETMKFVGPIATTAGQSIETFSALTAVMANAGIKGSLAGTALRSAFTRLADPPAEARGVLDRLKISVKNSSGGMRDMIEILDDVRKKTAKMSDAQRLATYSHLFGKRAIAGMSVVLGATNDELVQFRKNAEGSAGASVSMARDIRKSLGNRLKELQSTLIELGFRFLEAFVGKGEKGLDRLIEAIRGFDVQPIVDGVKSVFRVLDQVITGISLFGGQLSDLKPVIIGVTAAVVAAKAAQWLWNLAMMANPIGAIIAALAIAAVGIFLVAKNSEWASTIMTMTWLQIKDTILGVIESIQTYFTKMINYVIDKINMLLGLVSNLKIDKLEMPDPTAALKRRAEIAKTFQKQVALSVVEKRQAQLKEKTGEKPVSGPALSPEMGSALAQNISFEGLLNIAGAPKGSTVETKTKGAPPIKTEMLGAN